jgi:hypothetical protein
VEKRQKTPELGRVVENRFTSAILGLREKKGMDCVDCDVANGDNVVRRCILKKSASKSHYWNR